jgi:hypothetical protein
MKEMKPSQPLVLAVTMMVQMKYGNLTAEVVCKSLANLQS